MVRNNNCKFIYGFISGCRLFKDDSDNGYKINIDYIKQVKKIGIVDTFLFKFLIPIVKVFIVVNKTINYNNI